MKLNDLGGKVAKWQMEMEVSALSPMSCYYQLVSRVEGNREY